MLNTIKNICTKYNIDFNFIKFLFVGGINTIAGYLFFVFFLFIGLHYAIAAFISNICSIIFNFFSTGKLVFKNTNFALFFKFFLVYLNSWIVAVVFIHLYKIFVNNNEYLAGFIILIPNAILSYILMKFFVFKTNSKKSL